jgi:hypothetical protein
MSSKKSTRKAGQRKTDLSDETDAELLKKAKPLIRTDWGGSSDPESVIKNQLKSDGIVAGPKLPTLIRKMVEKQVESCRKRINPRLDEAIRRAEGRGKLETYE